MKRNALSSLIGIRSILCLPLVPYGQKDGVTIGFNGNISIYDKDFRIVEPSFYAAYNFTDKFHTSIARQTESYNI